MVPVAWDVLPLDGEQEEGEEGNELEREREGEAKRRGRESAKQQYLGEGARDDGIGMVSWEKKECRGDKEDKEQKEGAREERKLDELCIYVTFTFTTVPINIPQI